MLRRSHLRQPPRSRRFSSSSFMPAVASAAPACSGSSRSPSLLLRTALLFLLTSSSLLCFLYLGLSYSVFSSTAPLLPTSSFSLGQLVPAPPALLPQFTPLLSVLPSSSALALLGPPACCPLVAAVRCHLLPPLSITAPALLFLLAEVSVTPPSPSRVATASPPAAPSSPPLCPSSLDQLSRPLQPPTASLSLSHSLSLRHDLPAQLGSPPASASIASTSRSPSRIAAASLLCLRRGQPPSLALLSLFFPFFSAPCCHRVCSSPHSALARHSLSLLSS